MDNDIYQSSQRIAAELIAQQQKIQRVMERQRRRDVAAAYGKIIPFDENDIIKF